MYNAQRLTSALLENVFNIYTQTLAEAFPSFLFGTDQTRPYFLTKETSDQTNFR